MNPYSRSLLIFAILASVGSSRLDNDELNWKGFSVACLGEDEPVNVTASCHGIRLVRRIVQKMLEEATRKRSIEIIDGISLVKNEGEEVLNDARVLKSFGAVGSIVNFLQKRELRIRLRSLLPDNFETAVRESMTASEQGRGKGGGGGKKGDNGMIYVVMMGKMMVAMGFGALGLLAMKALMVSSLALMLSLIVAAKKLASKDDDSHHIVYAQQEHHRRRRSVKPSDSNFQNQPYRGYLPRSFQTSSS